MSPTAATTTRLASGRRPDIEAELADTFGVEYTFVKKVLVEEFDIDKSLANQARFEALDEETVELYKEGVLRGDNFPAVIAHRPGRAQSAKLVIIDGNHRLVAHERAGVPIDVYEIARGTSPKTIALMTFAFNTKHGRPTSEQERTSQALFLINNGASQESAAAAVNVPMRILRKAVAKANADARAAEVGIDPRKWENLPQSSKNRLLNISTDEGLHDAVDLVYMAKLDAQETFDLVALLNTSKSATKQKKLIRDERDRYSERIGDSAGGVIDTNSKRAVTPRVRLGMLLGQVTALPDDFGAMTNTYSAGEREEAAQRVLDAANKLVKLARAIDPALS